MPEKPTKEAIQATLNMLARLNTEDVTNTPQGEENEPEKTDLSKLLYDIVLPF